MKILVIGSGAREHALAWKLARESGVDGVICAPGNPGIAAVARCLPADVSNPAELLALAGSQDIDLTVVGPELPLSRGVVDAFTAVGRAIVGPTRLRTVRPAASATLVLHAAATAIKTGTWQ